MHKLFRFLRAHYLRMIFFNKSDRMLYGAALAGSCNKYAFIAHFGISVD